MEFKDEKLDEILKNLKVKPTENPPQVPKLTGYSQIWYYYL
jgi:hypothetical protein